MRIHWKKLTRDERIEVLRNGIGRGLSASEIAAEIDGCTRNSIIGLSHKTGINLPQKRRSSKKEEAEVSKPSRQYRPHRPSVVSKKDKKPNWRGLSIKRREKIIKEGLASKQSYLRISERFIGASRQAVKSFVLRMREREAAEIKERPEPIIEFIPDGADWKALSGPEKAAYVRDRAARGLSITQIAMTAVGATRSGVQSCAKRYGVALAHPKSARTFEEPKTEQKSVEPHHVPQGAVNIMDLTSGMCGYPVWEDAPKRPLRSPDDWMFCGAPTQPNSSYCPACHERVWEKPKTRLRYNRRVMAKGYL